MKLKISNAERITLLKLVNTETRKVHNLPHTTVGRLERLYELQNKLSGVK